jgi:hypothetical protein
MPAKRLDSTTKSRHPIELLERRLMLDSTVVFNEIMYHPAASGVGAAALEWVELYNQHSVDVDLSGWKLRNGIDYVFPEGTIIRGGGHLVISKDPAALQAASGYAGALGPFGGRLSDSGEKLELAERNGREMDAVNYGTRGGWPVAPDGSGVSLAKRDPNSASVVRSNWLGSARVGGTPGAVNLSVPPAAPVLTFNEISPGESGFVEITNPTATPQNLGGYVLKRAGVTDDQYVLPAGLLGSHGYLAFTPEQLGFTPVDGEKLFLFSADGNSVIDAVAVTARVRGHSGQGAGAWLFPDQPTPGAANIVTLHDQIVINEIMYHHQPQQGRAGSVQSTTLINVNDGGWKYEQSGTDLGTDWRESDSVDGGWASGQGVFYAGNVPGVVGAQTRVAIPGLFGTGLNAAGQNGTAGASDTHYTVTPPGALSRSAVIMTPHPAWAPNSAGSGWISPVQDGNTAQAVGDFVYKTTFSLDGFVPSTASLTLTTWTDNGLKDVLINGRSLGVVTEEESFRGPHGPFVITSGLVGGLNALEFIVNNASTSPNPHGLRAAVSGTALPIPKNTQLTLGPRTYYFRKSFEFSGDVSNTQFVLDPIIDDGAVFYLNGVEIHRKNMADGPVHYDTPASPAVVTPAFGVPVTLTLPAGALRQGTNVLAVEVHQAAGDVSDVAMGLQLTAIETTPAIDFTESDEQWIELYNRSTESVDLGGWRLNDAIEYTFPADTLLGPGEFLVVAEDAAVLAAKYPLARIVGSYSGELSRSDEEIELLDPAGNPADEVHYFDGKPWSEAADGGGSSLELRDPDADNTKPESWAASDESGKSAWKTYTYSGVAVNVNGDPTQWNEFVLGLLDAGEVLLDEISVIDTTNGSNMPILQNGTFESGATAWRIIGNHGRSSVITDPTNSANKVLRLIATGPTETMHNHAETTLVNNQPIIDGHTYQISFRAKWITGSNLLNTRLYFNRVAKTTAIEVPQANGTPGAQNSTYQANVGPTFGGLSQTPVLPAAGQAVTISVNVADPQGVGAVSLFYSVNGGAWFNVPMTEQSDRRYAGSIPGQLASATVQFYVQATDGLGAIATYPAAGPNSRALYKVNDGVPQAPVAHTMRIIMTPADIALLYTNTNVMSNDMLGATVVYDNREVYYDVGVSLYSSQRGRVSDARIGFKLEFNADHLFRGVQSDVTIDRSGNARPQDEILLKHVIAHAGGGVPANYNDIVKVIAPRSQNTGSALLMQDPYGGEYLDAAFDNGGDGTVYKLELIYYPTQTTDGNPQSLKIPQNDIVVGVDIQDLGNDKENYRHHYQLTNQHDRDDFTPMMQLAKAFSLSGAALDAATKPLLDIDEWMRMFAIQSLSGITDAYAAGLPHNLKLYDRPDGRIMALPWDWDQTFGQPTNAGLVVGANVSKVINLPTNKHLYYGHLHDVITTTYNTTYMSRWATHYGNLAGQDYGPDLTYIGQRAAYVLSVLPPQIPFSITTPSGQTVNQPTITLTGKGWINVKQIFVQGSPIPLDVNWSGTNMDTWTAAVPLYTGLNHLTLTAYDFGGKPIASQSIDVTSTANTVNLPANLRVTELNYNPAPPPAGSTYDAQDFEFIEFKNYGTQPLNLQNARFIDGIAYTFGDVTLAPGQVGVLVRNLAAFQSRHGIGPFVLGSYAETHDNFNNGGEHVLLVDSVGQTVVDFTYDNDVETGWYAATDGGGASLEVINPTSNAGLSDPANWRASASVGGTPGADTSIPPLAPANLIAVGGGNQVTVSWTPVDGAASYNVYRSTTPLGQGDIPSATGVTGTRFVDATAAAGITYYYVLTAVNPADEGPRSAEVFAHSHFPGDANDDGIVNFTDLVTLAQNYGAAGNLLWDDGDFTSDGLVDFKDLVILAQNYNGVPQSAAALMRSLSLQSAAAAAPPPPPVVTRVYVSSTQWTAEFKQQLFNSGAGSAAYGYSLPAGSAQSAVLPWANLDQVSISFDKPVSLDKEDLVIRGISVPSYSIVGFRYDAASHTATWMLASGVSFARDRVALELDGDGLLEVYAAGFESSGFVAGALEGQGGWLRTGRAGSAIVQSGVGRGGGQGVVITRQAADERWALPRLLVNPAAPVVVSWDMYVQQTNLPLGSFGPFMGVEAYDEHGNTPRLAGSAGVDAATGELLYQLAGTGYLVAVPNFQIAFDTWHRFELVLNYSTDTYSVLVDGVERVHGEGFVDAGVDDFTDASIAALAAAGDPVSQLASGVARIDNYSIAVRNSPVNADGLALDGEWENGGDAFPSGDGAAGGDFRFSFSALAGDMNRDARVDFGDLVILAQNYNRTGGWAQGDVTADSRVGFEDLVVLAQRYNSTLPAVQEPSASASVLATSAAVAPDRRRAAKRQPKDEPEALVLKKTARRFSSRPRIRG